MPLRFPWRNKHFISIAVAGAAILLAACQDSDIPKQLKPVPAELSAKMKQMNMSETGSVFIRIFKESSELEVWKETRNGRYALLKTYDICKWSGVLGPKIAEGDRQAPEGFYTVTPGQMNPNSSYYLAFNIGYPNAFDRAHNRTGSHLMVHGACSSAGCYSMTDESAGELFALARDAFRGGQRSFQIQAFPFRMTPENMARHRDNEHYAFWQNLKAGYDHFELTRVPPKVDVCEKRYVFNADAGGGTFSPAAACPAYEVPEPLRVAVARKQAADEAQTAAVVARLTQEARTATEAEQIADGAAQERPAQQATAEAVQEKPKIFGRIFGRDDSKPASNEVADPPTAAETSETPVTAFAPASTPVPPVKPGEPPQTATSAGSAGASATSAPPPPPASPAPAASAPPPSPPAEVQAGQADSQPAITQEMTPEIPEVGRFVKKEFLWVGEDG